MKLEEAVEILGEHVEWCDRVKEVETFNALKLGIEALKCIVAHRREFGDIPYIKLTGETED